MVDLLAGQAMVARLAPLFGAIKRFGQVPCGKFLADTVRSDEEVRVRNFVGLECAPDQPHRTFLVSDPLETQRDRPFLSRNRFRSGAHSSATL